MKKFFRKTTQNLTITGICLFVMTMLCATGCEEATYPKETLKDSIIELCAKEYGLDIDAKIIGSTLAIYAPIATLFDITMSLSESAEEKIQDILFSAARVVLSTDADIKFYCVIAQDIMIPEIQLVIIKYTDDIKKANYQYISREEYFKRTIIDINENPQAKKERAIIEVFAKMELEEELQTRVLEDFFRSPPATLEGIGYWNGEFYVKDITLEEFLAEQMAGRLKMRFTEEEDLRRHSLRLINANFIEKEKRRSFNVSFNAESMLFIVDPAARGPMEKEIFSNAVEVTGNVIYGYKYEDFDLIEIIEKNTAGRILISKDDMYMFKKGKLGLEAILGGLN